MNGTDDARYRLFSDSSISRQVKKDYLILLEKIEREREKKKHSFITIKYKLKGFCIVKTFFIKSKAAFKV